MTDMVDNVHNLQKTGMTREQAEAVAKVIRSSITEALEPVVQNMATKAEMAELRAELKSEIAASDKHTTLAVAFGCAAIVAAIIFG